MDKYIEIPNYIIGITFIFVIIFCYVIGNVLYSLFLRVDKKKDN